MTTWAQSLWKSLIVGTYNLLQEFGSIVRSTSPTRVDQMLNFFLPSRRLLGRMNVFLYIHISGVMIQTYFLTRSVSWYPLVVVSISSLTTLQWLSLVLRGRGMKDVHSTQSLPD